MDEINNTDEFQVSVSFPGTWTLKVRDRMSGQSFPGDFYTPLYIYEEDALIGYIGFNKFEPYTGEIPKRAVLSDRLSFLKAVVSFLLGSLYRG